MRGAFNRFGDEVITEADTGSGGGGVSLQRLRDELARLETRLRPSADVIRQLSDELLKTSSGVSQQQLNELEARLTADSAHHLNEELNSIETRHRTGDVGLQRVTEGLNKLRADGVTRQVLEEKLSELETKIRTGGVQQLNSDELNEIETRHTAADVNLRGLSADLARLETRFNEGAVTKQQLDDKLNTLGAEFNSGAKAMFSKLDGYLTDHMKDANALVQAIELQPKVIGVKHRRIVNMGKSSGKNDAVVRMELDAVVKKVDELKTKAESELKALNTWKDKCARTVSEIYDRVFTQPK